MTGMIDTGTAPEFYVDGIGSVDDLGDNCRTIYFTFARAPGSQVYLRMAAVKLVRPKSTLVAGAIITMLTAGQAVMDRLHS